MTDTVSTPNAQILGFNAPPDVDRELTNLPRAEVVFSVNQTEVTAGGAENQVWFVICNLPPNYFFVLVDVWTHIQAEDPGADPLDLAAWENRALFGLLDGTGVRVGWVPLEGGLNCQYKVLGPAGGLLPRNMIQGGVSQVFQWCNPDIGDPAVVGTFYARFLMYDVNQRHNVLVHNAIPVR